MPFGLKNTHTSYLIDEVVGGLSFFFPYIEDHLIAIPDEETHFAHLRQLYTRLEDYGIQINVEKLLWGF